VRYDFSVIGAGAAGMTAAVILAKHGLSVALVEASPKIGPLLRGFERKGIYFDTGFHFAGGLGDGGILDIFFRYLGISDKIQRAPFDPEGFDLFRFSPSEGDFLFPYGYDRIRDRLCEFFPGERNAIIAYLSAVCESFRSRPYLNLDREVLPMQELRSVHGPSLKEVLDSLSENDRLKRILSAHCYLHGATAGEVTFAQHAAVVGSYYESVHGLRGGGASIVRAFESVLSDHGVDVFCGQRVSGIDFPSREKPEAVLLANGERIACGACIVSTHPRHLLNLVPPGLFKPSYIRRLESLDESPSAFILYGQTRGCKKSLIGRNIFAFSSSNKDGFSEKGPLRERPIFIASVIPQNGAPEKHGFTAICPSTLGQTGAWLNTRLRHRPESYQNFKTRVLEILRHRIAESCPELMDDIEIIDGATPLTLRDFSNSPTGSLYGAKHRVSQYNPTPITRIEGLYLIGQAVVAPGVLGAAISAFLACGSILGHDRLRKELNACK